MEFVINADRGSVCCCCCSVTKTCLTLCDPMDCSSAGLLCPWDFPGKSAGVGCRFQGNLPDPGIEPGSPALQVDSLSLSHLGSHKFQLGRWKSSGDGWW